MKSILVPKHKLRPGLGQIQRKVDSSSILADTPYAKFSVAKNHASCTFRMFLDKSGPSQYILIHRLLQYLSILFSPEASNERG